MKSATWQEAETDATRSITLVGEGSGGPASSSSRFGNQEPSNSENQDQDQGQESLHSRTRTNQLSNMSRSWKAINANPDEDWQQPSEDALPGDPSPYPPPQTSQMGGTFGEQQNFAMMNPFPPPFGMFSGPQGDYNNGYANDNNNNNGYANYNANSHSIDTGGYQVIGNNANVTEPTKAEVKRAKAAAQNEKKGRKKKDCLTGKAGKVITVGKKGVNAAGRDPISAPSARSGGIPNPTEEYLSQASGLPASTPTPQPILVVIDLNGTLLYRPSKKQPTDFVERPHARKFMEYCINTFHVVVWSSARPGNVRNMCARLLTADELGRVVTVWGRDKFGLSAKDYDKRTQCYKRLTKLWEDPVVKAAHPDGESWDQGNTVLIDDSEEKARSEPYNAITLPEFAGDVNEEPRVLPLVHDYLNTLVYQADISTYIRTTPFKAN